MGWAIAEGPNLWCIILFYLLISSCLYLKNYIVLGKEDLIQVEESAK